jgi:hypothetical protein
LPQSFYRISHFLIPSSPLRLFYLFTAILDENKNYEQSCHKKKLLNSDMAPEKLPILASGKISEFFEKSPLSGAKKHPDFQVTLCLHFVTTNPNFAYIESE